MRHNPLIAPILHILKQSDTCLSEYELIRQLESGDNIIDVDAGYQLGLFKKHFMVMNALYRLQVELVVEGVYLEVSALNIAIRTVNTESTGANLPDHADVKLREYYLDWNNYDATGEAEVQQLLSGFWKRYAAMDKQQDALQVLGLAADTDWQTIRESYRRLARQHHPDKGGDDKKFIAIREAYEVLRCSYERK